MRPDQFRIPLAFKVRAVAYVSREISDVLERRQAWLVWPPASSPLAARSALLRFAQPVGDTPASEMSEAIMRR